MSLKRTNSLQIQNANQRKIQMNNSNQPIKTREDSSDHIFTKGFRVQEIVQNIQPKDIILEKKSNNMMSSSKNQKIPNSIRQSIIKMATGKKVEDELRSSKIALTFLRKMNKRFVCDICVCEYDQQQKRKVTNCDHTFCTSCLQHYVEYKISRFEQVVCPQQDCPEIMSLQSQLYQKLAQDQKKKHSKIRAFYIAQKTKSRLCPDEKCIDGIISIQDQSHPKCNKCNKIYCPNCFFPEHEGPCDKNQVDFFQNNFKFRQCSSCKAVIQKNQGCNHITCKCKYQFCYLCGGPWNNGNHRCNVSPQQLQRQQQQRQQQLLRIQRQAQIQREYEQTCEYKCKCTLKIFAKILLTPLFLLFVSLILLIMITLCLGAFALITLMGFFFYSVELICKERSLAIKIIQIILCPLIGLGGIVQAQCQLFPRACQTMTRNPCQCLGCLKEIFYDW